jgi:hypothetical protein
VTGEPLDFVKGTITSTGVFRKTEKQSYSKATGGVVRVTWKDRYVSGILTMSLRLRSRSA